MSLAHIRKQGVCALCKHIVDPHDEHENSEKPPTFSAWFLLGVILLLLK